MPLFHQAVVRALGLDRQAVEHSRLADSEIADVDHLLHFALAFGDDLAGLERYELAKLRFQLAQSVAELPYRFAADRPRRDSPFFESLLRPRDRLIVFGVRRGPDARQEFAVDRRKFFNDRAAAEPFAGEDAGIFVGDSEGAK